MKPWRERPNDAAESSSSGGIRANNASGRCDRRSLPDLAAHHQCAPPLAMAAPLEMLVRRLDEAAMSSREAHRFHPPRDLQLQVLLETIKRRDQWVVLFSHHDTDLCRNGGHQPRKVVRGQVDLDRPRARTD